MKEAIERLIAWEVAYAAQKKDFSVKKASTGKNVVICIKEQYI